MPVIKLTGRVKTLLVLIVLSDTKDAIKKHTNNFRICKLSERKRLHRFLFHKQRLSNGETEFPDRKNTWWEE